MNYQALLFCSEEKTARVVTQVLTELEFTVDVCNEPFAAVKKLMAQHFDAVVVDCENEQNATLLFKSARNSESNQNSLSVALVEGQAGVAKAFRIGANLVLTKPINVEQSKGTLRVARGLLRKAEAGKPATSTTETTTRPAQPSAPAFSSAPAPFRPAPVPFPAPPVSAPPMAVASASAFEVEEEPTPAPEPAEAALLESMADPTPRRAGNTQAQNPWPTTSKLSEPMAAALRRANEVTGKSAVEPAAPSSAGATEITSKLSFGAGAASAPAPAKTPAVSAITAVPKPAPATRSKATTADSAATDGFSHLAVKDHEGDGATAGTNKLPMIAVAAVVLLAAGYFGWTKMHQDVSAPAANVAQPNATKPATPAPTQSAAPTAQQLASASAVVTAEAPARSTSIAAPKAPAAIKAEDNEPDVITIKPATHPQPPVVKSAPAKSGTVAAEAAPVAPSAIGIPSSSDNKQIAGIVASAPATIPRATPQTLRVSQGVSQGLVTKRVQPIYPSTAQQMRIQGAVQLAATISKTGDISSVKVLRGDSILARAASDAVRQWKYKPYFLNGEPVEIQTEITVNFKLP